MNERCPVTEEVPRTGTVWNVSQTGVRSGQTSNPGQAAQGSGHSFCDLVWSDMRVCQIPRPIPDHQPV